MLAIQLLEHALVAGVVGAARAQHERLLALVGAAAVELLVVLVEYVARRLELAAAVGLVVVVVVGLVDGLALLGLVVLGRALVVGYVHVDEHVVVLVVERVALAAQYVGVLEREYDLVALLELARVVLDAQTAQTRLGVVVGCCCCCCCCTFLCGGGDYLRRRRVLVVLDELFVHFGEEARLLGRLLALLELGEPRVRRAVVVRLVAEALDLLEALELPALLALLVEPLLELLLLSDGRQILRRHVLELRVRVLIDVRVGGLLDLIWRRARFCLFGRRSLVANGQRLQTQFGTQFASLVGK